MAYKSFRTYVEELDKAGELTHIKAQVDWDSEIGAITRAIYKRRGPAMLFENIKDTPIGSLFCGAMHEDKKFGMMFDIGADIHEHYDFLSARMSALPKAPIIVYSGVCQENVLMGEDVDLNKFPSPKWHPLDGGRYIGTLGCVVTQDPDTGINNVAIIRVMNEGKDKLGMNAEQHTAIHLRKYRDRKENMPFAMAIGVPPAVLISGAAKVPYGVDEYTVAGAICDDPIPLVKCKTNDLYVPADAEVVIEGSVFYDDSEWLDEGPFGEFTGHFSADKPSKKPTGLVTCITYRNDPILQGTSPGVGNNENGGAVKRSHGANQLAALRSAGIPGVKDLSVLEMGCASFVTAVSLSKQFWGGNAQQAANLLMSMGHFPKIVVLVDDDIDVFDPGMVLWAVASRVQPSRDITILPMNQVTTPLDPSIPDELRKRGLLAMTSRMIIDATTFNKGVTFSKLVLDDEETKRKIAEKWSEYGFTIPY